MSAWFIMIPIENRGCCHINGTLTTVLGISTFLTTTAFGAQVGYRGKQFKVSKHGSFKFCNNSRVWHLRRLGKIQKSLFVKCYFWRPKTQCNNS